MPAVKQGVVDQDLDVAEKESGKMLKWKSASLRRNVLLAGLLALLIPVGASAQSSAQEPSVTDLQKQLQEMRTLMDKMHAAGSVFPARWRSDR